MSRDRRYKIAFDMISGSTFYSQEYAISTAEQHLKGYAQDIVKGKLVRLWGLTHFINPQLVERIRMVEVKHETL